MCAELVRLVFQHLGVEHKHNWAVIIAWLHRFESQRSGATLPDSQQEEQRQPAQLEGSAARVTTAGAFDEMGMDDIFVDIESLEMEDADLSLLGSGVAAGGPSGPSQDLSGSQPAGSNPLAGLSVPAVIQHLRAALGEDGGGFDKLYEKLLNDLNRDEVRDNSYLKCLRTYLHQFTGSGPKPIAECMWSID